MQHHIEGGMALSKEWMASCIHCVRRAFIFTLAVLARDINSQLPRHGLSEASCLRPEDYSSLHSLFLSWRIRTLPRGTLVRS